MKKRDKLFLVKIITGLILIVIVLTWNTITLITSLTKQKNTTTTRKVQLLLDWSPNTNHIGAYVARDKGLFKNRNLSVSILQNTSQSVEILVGSNKAEFGYSYQDSVIFARAARSNIPIITIAAVLPHNTSGFASLKSKSILTPKDFEGKRYGAFGSPLETPILKTVMNSFNANVNTVIFIQAGELNFFEAIQRNIYDFAWIFEGWTGIEAKIKNTPLIYQSLIKLDKTLDMYTPVIITSEYMVKNHSELVQDFISALQDAYLWSAKNPKNAAKILINAEPALNTKLIEKSMEYLAPKFMEEVSKTQPWGFISNKQWSQYRQWLHKNFLIPKAYKGENEFTNRFVLRKK